MTIAGNIESSTMRRPFVGRGTLELMSDSYRLVIARHATAASVAGRPDRERPLSSHGEHEAAAAGAWLASSTALPDRVVCSTARRTRETWDLIAERLPADPPVSYEPCIYDNDVDQLLELVRGTDPEARTLLLVGHNPAVYQLLLVLTEDHESRDGFPTGSLAVVDIGVPWSAAGPGDGALAAFWVPDHP
jgi:phosphohistidine phosphatase